MLQVVWKYLLKSSKKKKIQKEILWQSQCIIHAYYAQGNGHGSLVGQTRGECHNGECPGHRLYPRLCLQLRRLDASLLRRSLKRSLRLLQLHSSPVSSTSSSSDHHSQLQVGLISKKTTAQQHWFTTDVMIEVAMQPEDRYFSYHALGPRCDMMQ